MSTTKRKAKRMKAWTGYVMVNRATGKRVRWGDGLVQQFKPFEDYPQVRPARVRVVEITPRRRTA